MVIQFVILTFIYQLFFSSTPSCKPEYLSKRTEYYGHILKEDEHEKLQKYIQEELKIPSSQFLADYTELVSKNRSHAILNGVRYASEL